MKKNITHFMKMKKTIFAGIFGNSLEIYDFNIYAFYAAIIATHFFADDDFTTSLLATYGIFAAGFIMRPLGAILFGYIGDNFGRKKALEISILMMAIPTFIMGILPTYASIGILAPLFLTILRMFQGISVGGELVGSYSFLIEHAPNDQKGFIGSWSLVGAFGGKMLAGIVIAIVAIFLSVESVASYGWRIPFITGIFFAYIGFRFRKGVTETPVFENNSNDHKVKPWHVIKTYKWSILQAICTSVVHTVSVYTIFIYMPIYMSTVIGVESQTSLFSTIAALCITTFLLPFGGILSDSYGRKKILLLGSITLCAIAFPAFSLINSGNSLLMILGHLSLATIFGVLHGPIPAFFVELFPSRVRYTASAIAYNICTGVFGGFTPFICTWLINVADIPLGNLYWLIFSGFISIIGTLTINENAVRSNSLVKA
ncbi:MAG: MFS transporter [Chlamydiota bacterium]|nr:MFS transporter [Chlamydiota bacterium]